MATLFVDKIDHINLREGSLSTLLFHGEILLGATAGGTNTSFCISFIEIEHQN